MSLFPAHVLELLDRIQGRIGLDAARDRLRSSPGKPVSLRTSAKTDASRIDALWQRITRAQPDAVQGRATIADAQAIETAQRYEANIENYVGTVKIPVGVIGPLRINGLNATGDFFVPLATTEAALVASYARGAQVASRSGGIATALLYEGVIRAPAFVFEDLLAAGAFVHWLSGHGEMLKKHAEATTRHGRLQSLEPVIDANVVFLRCRFTTGDAAGQNMVTIATEALCAAIIDSCPVKPLRHFIEGNFSGDKKASYLGFLTGRGRKVTATVTITGRTVERHLGVGVDDMLAYAEIANLGARLSGQIGAQGHFANGLAALYIATGQDAACVAESAIGSTRMERRGDDLFMSVTMPNILVGSVGGGTSLPSQQAGLSILGLAGPGHADALAEVVAATCLAGEISIMAAIAGGHFTRAHRKLARER